MIQEKIKSLQELFNWTQFKLRHADAKRLEVFDSLIKVLKEGHTLEKEDISSILILLKEVPEIMKDRQAVDALVFAIDTCIP